MMVLVDTPVWSLALRRKRGGLNPQEQRLTADRDFERYATIVRVKLFGVV